jgi:hypothetical protein
MIESATARRFAGDWAGACAAARIDVDLDLRTIARTYGRQLAARLRADLRHLAPDLLRWHMPRIAPDGLLRPGLTISLARYGPDGGGEQARRSTGRSGGVAHLIVRTPPTWADAGQRISLALWDGSRPSAGPHPHPRPDRRFRLDLHRHLWDASCAAQLRQRSTSDGPGIRPTSEGDWRTPSDLVSDEPASLLAADPDDDRRPAGIDLVPPEIGCAVDRWGAEAVLLLRSDGLAGTPSDSRSDDGGNGLLCGRLDGRAEDRVAVRLDGKRWLVLDIGGHGELLRISSAAPGVRTMLPVLPDAATWTLPDLELLRAGLIDADQLHPLVAQALAPGYQPLYGPRPSGDAVRPRLVDCRGVVHRIGLVQGVLVPLDHDPAEIRREELLAGFGGVPMPCLQVIDAAHRQPEDLVDVRARLDHGDAAGALAVVERLLGPDALLRSGALLEELQTAALRRVTYGLYRAGLAGLGPALPDPDDYRRRRAARAQRRFATTR